MAYNPCQFDRQNYLESAEIFEAVKLDDAENELCEFNNDAEDLAFELAYTRYALAKAEQALDVDSPAISVIAEWAIKNGLSTGHADTMNGILDEIEWQIKEIREKEGER